MSVCAEINTRQLAILHHALGVRPDYREPYRDHYVAGPGHHAAADLDALAAAGMMEIRPTPGFCDASDVVYGCTADGRAYALNHLPLPPEKTKYDEWLSYDGCEPFSQFLGIVKPEIESRCITSLGGSWKVFFEYRMFRRSTGVFGHARTEVTGEWSPTKKAAKASYKVALKASKEVRR